MPGSRLIAFWRDERGSVMFESIFGAPIMMVFVVFGIFLHEVTEKRSDVVVATRTSAMNAALNKSCSVGQSLLPVASELLEGRWIDCPEVDAESEMAESRKFWTAARTAVRPYPRLLRDFPDDKPVNAIMAKGRAMMRNLRLGETGWRGLVPIVFNTQNMVPTNEFWRHNDDPWKKGYDPVLDAALRERGTYKLFPDMFPAAR